MQQLVHRPPPVPRFTVRPELTQADCDWINWHLRLAGSDHRYLRELVAPRGRAGTSSAFPA